MNSLTPSILYPALRSLIANRLQKSIHSIEFSVSYLTQSRCQKLTLDQDIEKHLQTKSTIKPDHFLDIPLNQINTGAKVEYVSAVAFKLTQFQSLSTLALAEQIRDNLNHLEQTVQIDASPERIWQNFMIEVLPPGWIHLRLTDSGLAAWLQWTIDSAWQPNEANKIQTNEAISSNSTSAVAFEIWHTYARCTSLLHLGKTENLIQFEPGQDCLSQPILWLNAEQTLRTQHPQDWALIQQLCETIDHLAAAPAESPDERQSLKAALRLSQVFQRFHAACRIWGMDQQEIPLAQARLGLVLLTQRVLQTLIEARLGWKAHSGL